MARHLTKAALVVPEPNKRPKSSFIRFEASMPNQCRQADFTHYRLTRPGADSEIPVLARRLLPLRPAGDAHVRVTGPIVLAQFGKAAAQPTTIAEL